MHCPLLHTVAGGHVIPKHDEQLSARAYVIRIKRFNSSVSKVINDFEYMEFKVDVPIPITNNVLILWNTWLTTSLKFHSIQAQYMYMLYDNKVDDVWLKNQIAMLNDNLSKLKDIDIVKPTTEKFFTKIERNCDMGVVLETEDEPTDLEIFIEMVEILRRYNVDKAKFFTLLRGSYLEGENRNVKFNEQLYKAFEEHDLHLRSFLSRGHTSVALKYIGSNYRYCLALLDP